MTILEVTLNPKIMYNFKTVFAYLNEYNPKVLKMVDKYGTVCSKFH